MSISSANFKKYVYANYALYFVFFVIFGIQLTPGYYSPDSIAQIGQAITGDFDQWHPTIFAFVWRKMLQLDLGYQSMYWLHIILYAVGFSTIGHYFIKERKTALGLLVFALAILPTSLVNLYYLWKDVSFAASLICLISLILWYKYLPRKIANILFVLLSVYMINVRHFSFLYLFPLIGYYLAQALNFKNKNYSFFKYNLLLLVLGFAVSFTFYKSWNIYDNSVLKSLPNMASHSQYFDMIGTLVHADRINEFPRELLQNQEEVSRQKSMLKEAYLKKPFDADVYARWGAAKDIVITDFGKEIYPYWFAIIRNYPASYLKHRYEFGIDFLSKFNMGRMKYISNESLYKFLKNRNLLESEEIENHPSIIKESPYNRWFAKYLQIPNFFYFPWTNLILSFLFLLRYAVLRKVELGFWLALTTLLGILFMVMAAPIVGEIRYTYFSFLTNVLCFFFLLDEWMLHLKLKRAETSSL